MASAGTALVDPTLKSRVSKFSVTFTKSRSLFENTELLFFSALGFGCLITVLRLVMRAGLPFEFAGAEGIVLAAATRVARGLSPYPPITQQLPYIINDYGPVPYYLGAICVKFFGVSFTAPRILVAVSAAWCATLIALLVRRWGGTWPVWLAFGLLYVATGPGQEWIVSFRADLIGVAFTLTGLYAYTISRRCYLSVPFFVLALFCKFTFLSAPFACCSYALCRRDWKKALGFATTSLVLGSLAFMWMQRETQGWFVFHTIWANASNTYSLPVAFKTLYKYQLNPLGFLIVLGVGTCYYARSSPDLWLPMIYLGSAFLSLLAVGKDGAADNYFLENYAALCLCGGIAYHRLCTQVDFWNPISALLPAALAALVMLNLHVPQETAPYSECRQAYEYLRTYPGTMVLSDNEGAVLMAGKTNLVNDNFDWPDQVKRGGWPETDTNLVKLIRSRKVDLILLGSNFGSEPWPASVQDAIQENYVLAKRFKCGDARFAYRPRP